MTGTRGPYDRAGDDEAYSATALGSQWFEGPGSVPPDRVEGGVLRFGPGVTALDRTHRMSDTTAARWHGLPAGPDSAPPRTARRRGPRRYLLGAVVLLAVLAFLAWQRYGTTVAVRDVAVHTAGGRPGCDGTADIVGVVRTDGRPGTVTYRWIRSDGTTSGELREQLARGQEQAELHLLWTFRGRGDYRADAELRVTAPTRHSAATRFTYHCG
ncbi:hypothetical protein OG349_00625 [Streptomyces sp. NBC_01317]|uniref:hypothetical protein n=1 Tax=Streptomyces sp. NBC_01317 TaxID=2903822 RepID=UPI002E0F049B|nr:hypothetical protein OG349_00625 [Streptomyces sp. NBC_01317]